MSSTERFPRRVTTESWDEIPYGWSRDGRWIYFSSNRSGRSEVWKVPAEGGEAIQLTTNRGSTAFQSPDGRFLYFGKWNPSGGPQGIWRVPVEGGEEEQVLEQAGFYDWGVTEGGLLYVNRQEEPSRVIEFFEVSTGKVSTLLKDQPSVWGYSVSPDQHRILYVKADYATDIMLVENFR